MLGKITMSFMKLLATVFELNDPDISLTFWSPGILGGFLGIPILLADNGLAGA
jgi:hypothetical protein